MEVTLTEEELKAILSLIGGTSVGGRVDMGVTREDSELLSKFYRKHKRIGED